MPRQQLPPTLLGAKGLWVYNPGRTPGGGGGGDSNIKMPGCVCWVSENVPILNGTFAQFIPNFDGNIKMELLIYRYLLLPLISYQFGLTSHCFNSVLTLLHPFLYNTSQKSYPYGMEQQISHLY